MEQEHVTIENIKTSHITDFPNATAIDRTNIQDQLMVRINGTLPDISTLGNSEEKSERAAQIKQQGISTNTSCSLFAKIETGQIFHILVDIGQGIVKSIENPTLGFNYSSSSPFIPPDALLITHSHDDHIKELPVLVNKVYDDDDDKSRKNLEIFCTIECRDQVIKKFPQLLSEKISDNNNNNRLSFNIVQPDKTFEVGPFSVMPILADHGDNSPPGSVIYIVKLLNRKIIIGWDFLSLPNADQNLFWNPDLLILGTQSYNPHPSTGMISVTEAYDIVRRWNAKECYIVQYSGLKDFEEATNQWFRGPVKPMTTDELQSVIDANLQVTGDNGKFRITVAKEGMVWTGKEEEQKKQGQDYYDESTPIGKVLEIESLQKYILKIENVDTDHKLKLMVEDRVNRFNLEFVRPSKHGKRDDILYAQGVKGMMGKGPELRMEIVPSQWEESSAIKIRVSRGKKKVVFKDDIYVSNSDAQRLMRYIKENFTASTK